MASVAAKVMSTVSAPYGALVTAAQLAEKIADIKSVDSCDCSVFAFLSEVSPKLQQSFIEGMGVHNDAVIAVAGKFSDLAGYKLPLAILMNAPQPSRRAELFDVAMAIVDQANGQGIGMHSWRFRDGTALMLQIRHRESHDIDLFIDDA